MSGLGVGGVGYGRWAGEDRNSKTGGQRMAIPRMRRIALLAVAALAWSIVIAIATPPAAGAATAPSPAGPATGPLPSGDLTVPNGDFENGLASWAASCAGTAGVSTDQHSSGTNAAWLRSGAGCPEPTLTSGPAPARPGQRYTGFVDVSARSGTARASLVFLDANRRVVGVGSQTHTGMATWTTLRPGGVAPAATAFVAIRAGAGTASGGIVYIDDARISRQFTDLGAQLSRAYVRAVTFGKDRLRQDVAYVVTDGAASTPARLVVIDLNLGTVQRSFPLNTGSSAGSWTAATATDGTIYVASFQPGALWAYTPGGAAPRRVATLPRTQVPFALAAAPAGRMYVGGYPGAVVYQYTPGKGLVTFADVKKLTGQDYVRSLAVDPTTRTVFIGVGARASVLACNEIGAKCTAILPAAYRGQQFAYQMSATPGRVFVYLSPSNTLLVLDVTRQSDGSFRAAVRSAIPDVSYPGATGDLGGKAYYRTTDGQLHAYDLGTGASASVAGSYPGTRGTALVTLTDQIRYPGATVVGVGTIADGVVIAGYQPQTGATFRTDLTGLPGAPVGIESVQRGPDGRIYSGGYLVGGLAAYTPMRTGPVASFPGLAQPESMTALGDTLYLGTYPGALVTALRPDAPLAAGSNPRPVCGTAVQGQDRPYAMAAGGGKIYIGTAAGYGQLQGALTVVDPTTGQCSVHTDLLRDESIVSLVYDNGVVYGGSLVWGGLGIAPRETHARLLIFDARTGSSRTVPLPVTSASLQGLTVGPDGRIWMLAQDTLLVYDPAQGRFIVQRKLFADLHYPAPPLTSTSRIPANDAALVKGADGKIYGTLHGTYFFRLDSVSAGPTVLYRGPVAGLTADSYGNLYFVRGGDHLARYIP